MNKIGFFDIETNGITDWTNLSDLTDVHCLAIYSEGTAKVYSGDTIQDGLKAIASFDAIVGHNSIGFDYPALRKMYGFSHHTVWDTAVMARCICQDVRAQDLLREGFDKTLIGSHSLKAWGHRIGVLKDTHGETEDWSTFTPAMAEYCKQDTVVTHRIYDHLISKNPDARMLILEYRFATIIRQQESNGFPFYLAVAEKLTSDLMVRRAEISEEVSKVFGPAVVEMKSHWWLAPNGTTAKTKKELVSAGWKAKEITKGPNRTKEIPFNPNSRDKICERLMAQGWKPAAFEGKRPKIDEPVLKSIGTPSALKLLEYLLVSKRLGQVDEGKQAWLKLERNGRIYGRVNTNGAVSGRCTHSTPNVAQTPA